MSRFSVAALINWGDHYSTECSPYSWKFFWHNWFTLTSAYLFIATVSPGRQSLRWHPAHKHVALYQRNAQSTKTLKCMYEWQEIAQALFELHLSASESVWSKTHQGGPLSELLLLVLATNRGKHSTALGKQQLLEQHYSWDSNFAASKIVFPPTSVGHVSFQLSKNHWSISPVRSCCALHFHSLFPTRQCNGLSLEDWYK